MYIGAVVTKTTMKKKPAARPARTGKSKTNEKLIPYLSFGADFCGDPDKALNHEWLETNGIGGFSSSSIIGANTRRYHGLLVAALRPPSGRTVTLSKLDETVRNPDGAVELGTNRYPGILHPEGFRHIEGFHLDPVPRWVYKIGGGFLEKTVLLLYGRNSVMIRYRWLSGKGKPEKAAPAGTSITARPFFAFRDYHSLAKRNDDCDMGMHYRDCLYVMRPYGGLPEIEIDTGGGEFRAAPDWYYNFEYDFERERGLDFSEDLFSPGMLEAPAGAAEWVLRFSIQFGPEITTNVDFNSELDAEVKRRTALLTGFEKSDEAARRLAIAADSFIVRRGDCGKTVIAGYHWFTDWGRDTMIALPGLSLATGRFGIARDILKTFAKHVRHGLVPNRFPDEGETPSYNSVDAALWFILAINEYIKYSGDDGILNETWGALTSIIAGFRHGTLNDIRMDEDCLITAGGKGSQLTWMDAKIGDWVVTPRDGKPVEINAMWHGCLLAMAEFAERIGADRSQYSDLAALVKCEFESQFWNEEKGCLYDVLKPGGADGAVRPNQVFALSLNGGLFDHQRRERILKTIEEKLLTPYGLRSLAPDEPGYRSTYEGGVVGRDGAYHQGTVWAWLIGPFVTAVWNVRGKTPETLRYTAKLIEKLEEHLLEAGLNSISEIFDGDAPHKPRGCIAQAWSVAELLRVKVELTKTGN